MIRADYHPFALSSHCSYTQFPFLSSGCPFRPITPFHQRYFGWSFRPTIVNLVPPSHPSHPSHPASPPMSTAETPLLLAPLKLNLGLRTPSIRSYITRSLFFLTVTIITSPMPSSTKASTFVFKVNTAISGPAQYLVKLDSYVTRINHEIHFSWQAQYLEDLECHFSWQAQHFMKF